MRHVASVEGFQRTGLHHDLGSCPIGSLFDAWRDTYQPSVVITPRWWRSPAREEVIPAHDILVVDVLWQF